MANLPLAGGRAALRLVGYAVSDGGYIDDPRRGRSDINRTTTFGGRATLRLDAGDDWTIDLGGTVQHIHADDSQYADRGAAPLTHASPIAQPSSSDYKLGDVVVAKDWDGLRLLSSTGVASQQLDERFDAGLPGGPPRAFVQTNDTLLVSNETRLWRPMRAGFGWVVGGSLLYNRSRLSRSIGAVGKSLPVTGVVNRIGEATLFGEGSAEPIRDVTLTAGVRVSKSRVSGDGKDVAPAFSADVIRLRAAIVASRSHARVLPSLAASWRVTPDTLLYVRYGEGFRPGGLSVDNDFVARFHGDHVATVETGVRHTGTALDVALSLARTRWRSIQADYVDVRGLPATSNIGDGRIYSASATATWHPTDGLALDASLIFNDGRITGGTSALLPLEKGDIPNVARLSGRAGIDYRADLGGGLDLRVGASARYTGHSRLGIGPILGRQQGDYVDTALTARVGRPALGVTLSLTNLADTVGNRFALGSPIEALNADPVTPLRPRTVRLGLDTRF